MCCSCNLSVVRNSGEGAERGIRTKERDGDMMMEFVMYRGASEFVYFSIMLLG